MKDSINILEDIISRNYDRTFVVNSNTDEEITYGQLYSYSKALAEEINSCGVKKGSNVVVLLPNCTEYALVYFALMHLRLVVNPVNPILHEKEIEYIVKTSEAPLLITTPELKGQLKEITDSFTGKIFTMVPGDYLKGKNSPINSKKVVFGNIEDDDLVAVIYTSGTTSRPKGVMIRYGSMISNGMEFKKTLKLDRTLTFYNILSLSYMGGWYNLLFIPFLCEAKVVIDNAFGAKAFFTFWDRVMKYKINALWVVPTIMTILLNDKRTAVKDYCKKNVKVGLVGTAPLAPYLKKVFEESFGFTVNENYGLSETFFIATNYDSLPYKEGSVGKIIDGCDVVIRDQNGMECASGEEGEIAVKSRYMMSGYYKDKPASELLNKGYFPTGDIGKINKDGYLYVTGRKKDLIIRGGVNISPGQIEDVLLRYDYIEEAAAVGVPHEIYGEEIIAVIKIKDNYKSIYDEKSLRQHCRDNLSIFKCPKKFIVIDAFPKSVTGKIQKNKIKSMLINAKV